MMRIDVFTRAWERWNELETITDDVVEAAASVLVIGS
ncbi:hypothetical protein JOF37_003088 [Microbacterium imperiale]|nr:hypothetical protein [Microbacterium imperiale]